MIVHPIDEEPLPPQSGVERDYLTRDLEISLEVVVRRLIEAEVSASGCGCRQAAVRVQQRLAALLPK